METSAAESLPQSGALPGAPTRADRIVMARALAYLFGAGATLALASVLLPHSPRANELGMVLTLANAYVVALLLLWRSGRVTVGALEAALAWGTVSITLVSYFSGESPSPLAFFYIWVALYASYFFTRPRAVLQLTLIALAYGAWLLVEPPANSQLAWWLVVVGTLVVSAGLILWLRGYLDRLIARLYDAARTDALTGLVNRRGFREALDLELARARRRPEARLAIVAGDLDHFKEVNDRCGHSVGDQALKRFAKVVSDCKRQIDLAARVGGEEFALLVPDADEEGAFKAAERLRACVRKEFADDEVALSISFGVAAYPQHGETAGALLQAADDALYAAKEQGRDRTVVHSAGVSGIRSGRGGREQAHGERYLATVLELAEALDFRFSGSARHSETVGRYAEVIARELGLPEPRVQRVRLAGILHDVGKVGVADGILRKPASLSEREWQEVRRHPELGALILGHPELADLRGWVMAHHERLDGRGYPSGARGDKIPLEARILAVADAYEAMTSDRVYRAAIGTKAARAELRRASGTQFDPAVVEALLAVLDREAATAQRAPLELQAG